jgi:hypothetical protein
MAGARFDEVEAYRDDLRWGGEGGFRSSNFAS